MAIKIRKRDDDSQSGDDGSQEQGAKASGSAALLQASASAESFIENNRNTVIAGVIALVVAALGIWMGYNYVDGQKVEASSTLSPALWDYGVPVDGSPEMEMLRESPNFDLPEKTFASDAERWEAVYETASSSLEKHQSGPLAQSARLTKAAAATNLGNHEEAVELYEEYLAGQTDKAMLPFVYLGLATSKAAGGDTEAATAAFDKLAEQNEAYGALAMYYKGQVLEGAGDVDQAKTTYHELLETYPQTPYRDDVERRLALL
jgi:tetratricopeptide (TPR) repeat protein